MADKKKMSIEDILAACRTDSDDGGSAGSTGNEPAEKAPTENKSTEKKAAPPAGDGGAMSVADILAAARSSDGGESESPAKPAAPKAGAPKSGGGAKSPGDMSVADILAAARGGGGETAAAKPAAKPAAKKAAAAGKAKAKPAAKAPAGPMDTSSILAAARSGSKPGPISKAEAAAQGRSPVTPKPVLPPMPEKPAYAKPKVKKVDADRRGIISVFVGSFMAVGFTSLSLTGLLSTLGLARFLFPNILIEPPSRFKVGFPSDFAPGSVATKFKAQFGVWIVNAAYEGAPQLVALKTVCTHLGCTPNWLEAEQKFKCPCHGSGFYKEGINFEGPAPRPLERYAIRVADDGQIEIDKSKTFQQEMGQWTDGSSFVPV